MVGAGFVMLRARAWAACSWSCATASRAGRLASWTCCLPAIALPYIANSAGWMLTEMGRQPWIVFGLQKTADAVSPT